MSVLISLASGAPVVGFRYFDAPPTITDGGAIWDTIDRPKRRAFTNFSGVAPYQQTMKVMLDRWAEQGDCEPEIRLLEDRQQLTGNPHPDVLKLTGAGVKRPDLNWVLVGIEHDDATLHRSDGRRSRFVATLTFLQHVEIDLVIQNTSPAAAARAR